MVIYKIHPIIAFKTKLSDREKQREQMDLQIDKLQEHLLQ